MAVGGRALLSPSTSLTETPRKRTPKTTAEEEKASASFSSVSSLPLRERAARTTEAPRGAGRDEDEETGPALRRRGVAAMKAVEEARGAAARGALELFRWWRVERSFFFF